MYFNRYLLRHKKIFFTTFLLLGSFLLQAQSDTWQPKYNTPYQTVRTYFYYLQSEHFDAGKAAKTLNVQNLTLKQRQKQAIKLKRIIDGKALTIELATLPNDTAYVDSASGSSTYILFEDAPWIYLEKTPDGKWLFSTYTVKKINTFYNQVYPFGLGQLIEWLAGSGGNTFLGLDLWKWLAMVVLVVFSLLVFWIFTIVIHLILSFFDKKLRNMEGLKSIEKKVTRPLALYLTMLLLSLFLPIILLPAGVLKTILMAISIAKVVFATMVFLGIVDFAALYFKKLTEKTENEYDDQLAPLIGKTLKVIVVFTGIMFGLHALGVNLAAILTGISIGGIAFALAAQDTIKNFFGSIVIFTDRPFKLGDWIACGDIEGTVEEIGFRATRIRTFHNSVLYVPNAQLANEAIDNLQLRKYRRYSTTLGLAYNTSPEALEAFAEGCRQIVVNYPIAKEDMFYVGFTGFGASALEILFYVFIDAADWAKELEAKTDINIAIMQLADTLKLQFAYPSQSLYIEQMPDKGTKTQRISDKKQLSEKVQAFIKAQNFKQNIDS